LAVHRTRSSLGFFLVLGVLFVSGCVPLATDNRKEAFRSFDRSFASLDESPSLNEVIDIGGVKIHIVGHRHFFNLHHAAAYGSPVVGYATSNNEIWVFGKVVKGKIVVNQAVLGHELVHLLQFKDPRVANPDKLDDLGA
jgi:hypothetical protein